MADQDLRKRTVYVYDYTKTIKNLEVNPSFIDSLQKITSKKILASSNEDQLRLPETIQKFEKLMSHDHSKGQSDVTLDEWEQEMYTLFALVQYFKYEANAQGLATEKEVEYDGAELQALTNKIVGGDISPDLADEVEKLASTLKIV
jgi:hypothetical protein